MSNLWEKENPVNIEFTGFISCAEDEGLEPSSPKGGGFQDR